MSTIYRRKKIQEFGSQIIFTAQDPAVFINPFRTRILD